MVLQDRGLKSQHSIIRVLNGSAASTKFNRFQLIKFKYHEINSIENQHFSYLSDSIFLKEKQKNRQMRQNHNSKPRVINIDKSGANKSGIRSINRELLTVKKIKIRQCKYLNNIVEQDHRNIKRRISIDTGFKEFDSAQRTLAGIEVVNIIRKGQIADSGKTTFKTFCSLAA